MNLVQRHASWNSTNLRVTIVEADIALALALSHNLKTEGYVVESLDRGEEAVRKLADAPPDLVILDWMSSGMSGPEICTRSREEDGTRMLPIIMLSARGEEVLRLRGFGAGADDFLVKPFSMRELIARVRALLRRSRFAIERHARVWGPSVDITRAVDVHIGRLRQRLSTGRERDPIVSVRGAGYSFDESLGKPWY